jgi:RNA ligase (TIGR02306 family)
MSEVCVVSAMIDEIIPHPNADKLDLAKIGEYTTAVVRGEFKAGDLVAFFPPDILIPPGIALKMGVAAYLKPAVYPGEYRKSACRVAAVRLRGSPSFGFCLKIQGVEPGVDLSGRFHAVKYEPPEPLWWNMTGDNESDDARFYKYTSIENYRNSRFRGAFETGLPVRITEKIHGTNSRVALLGGDYFCGSHQCNKREYSKDVDHTERNRSLYWRPLTEDMKALLWYFASEKGPNVIAYGEIYGAGVQFMSYGAPEKSGYRLFDISVNGEYVNWGEVEAACRRFCIPTVPLLYLGPFYPGLVDSLVDGPTTVVDPKTLKETFTGREGIVITPLQEQSSNIMGGRLIAKAVSVDYLACRKSDSH